MDDIIIQYTERPKLKSPIFIEGLPGVGNVGKLAADHLIDFLGARLFATLYSKYFPPQVLVEDDGVIRLVSNKFYCWKAKKNGLHDLILLGGDYQGLTPEGQYQLADRILDVIVPLGVKKMITLGGYGVGKMVEAPRVLGAATDHAFIEELKKFGVVFSKGEPGSGIVGASGLLLGLGVLRNMKSACLMGETSGYFVDPKSARAILLVLSQILGMEFDLTALDTKAQQLDKLAFRFAEMERGGGESPEDLRYIG